jgi:hypothetical protein
MTGGVNFIVFLTGGGGGSFSRMLFSLGFSRFIFDIVLTRNFLSIVFGNICFKSAGPKAATIKSTIERTKAWKCLFVEFYLWL